MSEITAPERLVEYWARFRKSHKSFPIEVSYHPRSDDHSKVLCAYVLEDLVASCEPLRRHALAGAICYDVNHDVWHRNGSKKVLDLVIGQPAASLTGDGIRRGPVTTPGIRLALEAKACMTKHRSALPRLRDELRGSMESAVDASPHAVVGGVVVVNIASSFLSPTHQPDPLPADPAALRRRPHRQPQDAEAVIAALDNMPYRRSPPDVGFDSMGIIVVEHDNEVPTPTVRLVRQAPAPPSTSPRDYRSFIIDMGNKYARRFPD